jgi:hypothetical protein
VIKVYIVFSSFPYRIGLRSEVPKRAIIKDKVSDLRLLDGKGFFHRRSVSPILPMPLSGEVVSLEKLLPGKIHRRRIFFIVLIKLVDISNFRV